MSEMVTKNNEMPGNSGKEHNVDTKVSETSDTGTNDASAVIATVTTAVDVGEATAKNLMAAADTATSPKVENKKPSTKRTPSKRLSFIERAQKESEELVKNLGGSLELEGGRRTRSSTRGTPTRSAIVATPPPVKKARASPATSVTPTTPRRGRGRKIDISKEPAEKQLTLDENKTTTDTTDEETTNNEKVLNKNDSKNASIEKSGDTPIEPVPNKTVSSELSENSEITPVSDAEDKTDAVALEVIPEEDQNNVDHCSESTERSGCNTSVETADVSKSLNVSEAIAAPAQNENVEKEPLPKPMETDSAICSDTVEPLPATAESIECSGETSRNSMETSSVEEAVTVQNSLDAQTSIETSTTEVPNPEVTIDTKAVTTVPEIVEEEIIDESSAANDTQEIGAPNELSDIAAAGESQATTKQTTIAIAENTAKSGNDLCEPKIVSPSTTDEVVAATPQYCN